MPWPTPALAAHASLPPGQVRPGSRGTPREVRTAAPPHARNKPPPHLTTGRRGGEPPGFPTAAGPSCKAHHTEEPARDAAHTTSPPRSSAGQAPPSRPGACAAPPLPLLLGRPSAGPRLSAAALQVSGAGSGRETGLSSRPGRRPPGPSAAAAVPPLVEARRHGGLLLPFM